MELKLTFKNDNSKGTDIPIDYQYFVASWIYSIISKGDAEYEKIKKHPSRF
jgi:CRISPR/Cas system endoribonuclease Cas6 (RAMP superfamily)